MVTRSRIFSVYDLMAFSQGGTVINSMLAELATVLHSQHNPARVGHIFDWESQETAPILPQWEASQRIARYVAERTSGD